VAGAGEEGAEGCGEWTGYCVAASACTACASTGEEAAEAAAPTSFYIFK